MYVNFYDFILKNQKKRIPSILLMQIKDDIKRRYRVSDGKSVLFNGVEVIPLWPEYFAKCQLITQYNIGGKEYPRLRYSEEGENWDADNGPCHDCAALKGQYHAINCDVERCPKCGGQVISCGCDYDEDET